MPTATAESGQAALQHVRDNIEGLNGRSGIQNTDLIFLKGLIDSPIMKSLIKVQDRLENPVEPVRTGNVELAHEVRLLCMHNKYQREAKELANLLDQAHVKALLESHDNIAKKINNAMKESLAVKVEDPPLDRSYSPDISNNDDELPDTFKMIGLRKSADEPLGITVKIEGGELVVARILGGGMIDRQGLLHEGDIVKEVNGVEVFTPEDLQHQLQRSKNNITFKVVPAMNDQMALPHSYVKVLFTYNPNKDSLLPCSEIGLPFKQGEILQILNRHDPNWWQARKVTDNGPTGLIPSQELEEKRKAFVRPEFDYASKTTICGTKLSKNKRKQMYLSKQNAEFDKAELMLYEEVAKMPPFQRKTLVMIGAQGVGRRSLKNRFITNDSHRFGTIIPYTSRPPRDSRENDGKSYVFSTREAMEDDINNNLYLEFGEHNGHLYGTKLDSIRGVIRSGKMCILDCNPQALKILNTPEFMPFVVFIGAPSIDYLKVMHEHKNSQLNKNNLTTFERATGRTTSRRARTMESLASVLEEEDLRRTVEESARLLRAYEKFFDLVLINENIDHTYEALLDSVNALSAEPQWVPVSWVY